MTRRPGLTLVEVLTALFIMALGTIAILTLFPLGAIQMGQAIRDSRSTESAAIAEAYIATHWKTYITEPAAPDRSLLRLVHRPGPRRPLCPRPPAASRATPSPSTRWAFMPAQHPPIRDRIGTGSATCRPTSRRRNLGTVTNPQHALRLCSLMDTMGFDKDGMPNTNDRELRYNWLWIIQPPDMSNPKTANMTVVVFDRRAHLHATRGAEDVLLSTVVPATPGTGAVPGLSSVTFDSLNAETKIQPGTWIMDGDREPHVADGQA